MGDAESEDSTPRGPCWDPGCPVRTLLPVQWAGCLLLVVAFPSLGVPGRCKGFGMSQCPHHPAQATGPQQEQVPERAIQLHLKHWVGACPVNDDS